MKLLPLMSKGVKIALCGMKCIDPKNNVIKILNIYIFLNKKKLELEKNLLNHVVKIQNILKLWKLRNSAIERRIFVFKSLAISKLIHLDLVTEIPISAINLVSDYTHPSSYITLPLIADQKH